MSGALVSIGADTGLHEPVIQGEEVNASTSVRQRNAYHVVVRRRRPIGLNVRDVSLRLARITLTDKGADLGDTARRDQELDSLATAERDLAGISVGPSPRAGSRTRAGTDDGGWRKPVQIEAESVFQSDALTRSGRALAPVRTLGLLGQCAAPRGLVKSSPLGILERPALTPPPGGGNTTG